MFLGDAPSIEDGAVVVDDRGAVLDVGRADEILPRHDGAKVVRVEGAVAPGLVNAHTHLELSALRGRVPGGRGFIPWVETLIGARMEQDEGEEASAIDAAVRDLVSFGTVAVGEVTNSLAAVRPLADAKIAGSIFHEVFGLAPDHVRKRAAALETELAERLGEWPSDDLAWAPAPHTLYTTDLDVVRLLVSEARTRSRRTTIHMLEHPLERRAIEHGDGPVVDWLEARVRMPRDQMRWPKKPLMDVAVDLGLVEPDVLLVHLTEATPNELEVIAKKGAPVVLCPRSNLYIGAKLPPALAVREAGIAAALGTDSLASNLSLDVLAEARALHERFPTIPPSELLGMATWNGARALGRLDLGRITKGARPGLLAFETQGKDPWKSIITGAKRSWVVKRT
jgi:cytosine/adenosine deaminase-related metal-dependent hydrolase